MRHQQTEFQHHAVRTAFGLKIVDLEQGIHFGRGIFHFVLPFPGPGTGRMAGIAMQQQVDRHVLADLRLGLFQQIVDRENIGVDIDLGVSRGEILVGAVIVHDDVMHAADAAAFQQAGPQFLDEFGTGRLAQERIDRLAQDPDPAVKHQQGRQKTRAAVNRETGEFVRGGGDQHHDRAGDIAQAVDRHRLNGPGIDQPADVPVKEEQPDFEQQVYVILRFARTTGP